MTYEEQPAEYEAEMVAAEAEAEAEAQAQYEAEMNAQGEAEAETQAAEAEAAQAIADNEALLSADVESAEKPLTYDDIPDIPAEKRTGTLDLSKCQLNECKNSECRNARRHGSAYCQECSDRHDQSK